MSEQQYTEALLINQALRNKGQNFALAYILTWKFASSGGQSAHPDHLSNVFESLYNKINKMSEDSEDKSSS